MRLRGHILTLRGLNEAMQARKIALRGHSRALRGLSVVLCRHRVAQRGLTEIRGSMNPQ